MSGYIFLSYNKISTSEFFLLRDELIDTIVPWKFEEGDEESMDFTGPISCKFSVLDIIRQICIKRNVVLKSLE